MTGLASSSAGRSASGEVERDLGALVPPIAVHAPAPRTIAAAWTMLRAVVVEPGLVDRTTKEAVATAIAHGNGCWSCEDLHLTVLESLNRRRVDCELSTLSDQRVRRVTDWARSAGMQDTGEPRPFADSHVPELVGTVVVSHYLSRMATVLSDRTSRLPDDDLRRVASRASRGVGVGRSWLPVGHLPVDMGWARGRPSVAEAFGRAASGLDGSVVSESVRLVVSGRLAVWRGEVPDDDEWLGPAMAGLASGDMAAGRLALLTAIAPRRVDRVLVDVVRGRWGEQAVVEMVAWAAFAGARRIATWLAADVSGAVAQPEEAQVIPFRRTIAARRAVSGPEQRQAEV
ncbi:MAG TPA: carboxymuconolactone decarboxylase family protein [Pseudonocardiaceae bacterium]|nr:carboxymuconolactone decarboxylase family protein [Pseudonocardiaceae bacterium]